MEDDDLYERARHKFRRNKDAQEDSKTGNVDSEVGDEQRFVESLRSPDSVASPQSRSEISLSRMKRREAWERDLGIRVPRDIDKWDSEKRKYWEYRNIYQIPVPEGIEYWEDEDKERWEMINIGGMNESEADQRIKSARRRYMKERQRESRELRDPGREDVSFVAALICFGVQMLISFLYIGFCIYQFIIGEVRSGIVVSILACIAFFGAVGGIFSVVLRSRTLGIATAIYNLVTGVGIIAATAAIYSTEKIEQQHPLSYIIPFAGVVALIQIVSFGIVLIIYRSFLSIADDYPRVKWKRPKEAEDWSYDEEQLPTYRRRRYEKREKLKEREEIERQLDAKVEAVTIKCKRYLQKKGRIAKKSNSTTVQAAKKQMAEPKELNAADRKRQRAGLDIAKHCRIARIHKKLKNGTETGTGRVHKNIQGNIKQ